MAKKNIDLAVILHDDCDYKDWLVELKERFYSHRLKASCATNGYLLDFYWKLGRDIEAKQYTNTYGSGFYKNLSQDLKNEMPGVKGFSPTNLKYMSYFYKLYAPLQANCPQLADNFIEGLYIADIQRVVAQSKNRPQTADDFKLLFLIPWDHHRRICSHRAKSPVVPPIILGTTKFLCVGHQPSVQDRHRQSYHWLAYL